MQFPIVRAGRSQEGMCLSAAVCCTPALSASRPQQGWELQLSCLSAMVQGKPGPPPEQTCADPFFCCRATTATSFNCAEKDFGFTTQAQHYRRTADKFFCTGKCSIELCLHCLRGCVASRSVLTGGFAVRKVALSCWLPRTSLILPPWKQSSLAWEGKHTFL